MQVQQLANILKYYNITQYIQVGSCFNLPTEWKVVLPSQDVSQFLVYVESMWTNTSTIECMAVYAFGHIETRSAIVCCGLLSATKAPSSAYLKITSPSLGTPAASSAFVS